MDSEAQNNPQLNQGSNATEVDSEENRSPVFVMKKLEEALAEIEMDGLQTNAYSKVINYFIALGNVREGKKYHEMMAKLDELNASVAVQQSQLEKLEHLNNEISLALEEGDFETALEYIDKTLKYASACTSLKMKKVECLLSIKEFGSALNLVQEILKFDSENVRALYFHGACLYYTNNIHGALNIFKKVLELDPTHEEALQLQKMVNSLYPIFNKSKKSLFNKEETLAYQLNCNVCLSFYRDIRSIIFQHQPLFATELDEKLKQGNNAYILRNYIVALQQYTDALKIDPTNDKVNAILYYHRAFTYEKIYDYGAAISDCSESIKLCDTDVNVLLSRAFHYMEREDYEEAIQDFQNILAIDNEPEIQKLLETAQRKYLESTKNVNYHKILGIPENASFPMIKKAFYRLSLLHHPDRHMNASEYEKKWQEKKFKIVSKAYQVLSEQKRI